MDAESKEIDLKQKNLLSWQIILNGKHIVAGIEEKLVNQ